METKEELKKNIEEHRELLKSLYGMYEYAELLNKEHENACTIIANKVLAENEFYATEDFTDAWSGRAIRKGDRITDDSDTFLLVDEKEEHRRLLKLYSDAWRKAGLTDKEGFDTVRATEMWLNARNLLIDFIIDNILPFDMQVTFKSQRQNVVQMDKMLGIVQKAI